MKFFFILGGRKTLLKRGVEFFMVHTEAVYSYIDKHNRINLFFLRARPGRARVKKEK